MAQVENAFDTYEAQANREDLSNIIYNIDPMDTPLMSMIGRRNASNVTFDWQTEKLPDVSTTGELEGFELARAAATPTVRVSNTCQINKRDATVTGSQNTADAAGKSKEMAHQMALSSKALKRDVESVLISEQGRDAGSEVVVRATRAWESWIATNVSRGVGGTNAPTETDPPADGTQRALTEDLVLDTLQLCYTNGAEPTRIMVGPYNKRVVSTFTGREQSRQNIGAEAVQQSVSIYQSDFGDLAVLPSRWQRERSCHLIDPNYAATAFYRNFFQTPIAKIGDADTNMIVVEYGLEMKNEAAHGIVADLLEAAA